MQKHPGYFTFNWEEKTGKIWVEIDKFDTEFIYVFSLTAGLGSNDVGLDRSQLGGSKLVRFQRVGPKVLLVQSNHAYRAVSDNPDERKAVEDSFARSVIWGFQVEAEQEGRVLVDATTFVVRDARNVVATIKQRGQGDYELDMSRSAVYLPNTKNFPCNTEFEALLTFTSKNPGELIGGVAPDPRSITLRQHHSFVPLPDNGFKSRSYDPRSNFSAVRYMDYATPVQEPIMKRLIRRHRIQKKDPSLAVSEPVKPIIYYVDRGVPEPVRSALLEGAAWWNQAFEAAGFKNGFRTELLPEGVDPLDIRYNVINWVHRSTRGWSYGSGVTDPRTGEIIKGHVSIGSLRVRQDFLIAQGLKGNYEEGSDNSSELLEMALARIRQLSCHEVGHAIGLGHNYAASVNDRASVMDYPAPTVKISEEGTLDLSDAYDTGIGEWDKVSIEYGYKEYPKDTDEEKEIKAVLDKAFSSGLYFLSGGDAGPGSAHPLCHPWDNGRNPVDELQRTLDIRAIALGSFSEKRIPVGAPLATLEEVLVPLYLFHRYQVEATATVLGGLLYNHRLRGDVQKNCEMVPAQEQRRALSMLLKSIHPETLAIPEGILRLIAARPPDYPQHNDLFPGRTGLPFDPLAAAETASVITLDALLHPDRAARIVEYSSRSGDLPTLGEVLDKTIAWTWKSRHENRYHAAIQRVVDDVLLGHLVRLAANEKAASQVRATTYLKLVELKDWLRGRLATETCQEQKAHFLYGMAQIAKFETDMEADKLTLALKPPQGPPI